MLARAFASQRTPPEFNLKFNQNLTTHGSGEDHFSYFSNVEEEGTSELGDYFSDDEEDDTWDKENLTSESNLWSHSDFKDSEENFTHPQPTLSEWNPVISGLETINEVRFEDAGEADELNHISGLSEETKLAFSTWQPFIPPEHAFRNCAAPSQLLDFLLQASSLQEPTLTQISANSTSTKRTSSPMKPTSPQLVTSISQPKDLPSFKLATRPFTPTWTKLQNKSTKTSTEFPDQPEPLPQLLRTKPCKPFYSPTYSATPTSKQPFYTKSSIKPAIPSHEFPDHPEPSKRYKPGSGHCDVPKKPTKTRIPNLRIRHR